MTLRTVRTEAERDLLVRFIKERKKPFTVEITDGRRRSIAQNKTQRLWLNEAAEQLGDRTAEELRGECKLMFGVPILRAENEEFREKYDAFVKPLPYPQKLALMMEPLDMPVTRLMTVDQKTRYLDKMCQHLLEMGIALTIPDPAKARAA